MSASPAPSPFKGLARYDEADASYFFGRDADAELVVANLLAARLTLLFGESGVGKSSLLHAGVAPRLRALGDLVVVLFSDWRGDAAASLAAALRAASGLDPGAADVGLAATIAACAERTGCDLVVVLDQFEEYFVYHQFGQDAFALEFPRAIRQADLPVSFLIAVREDALARLERFKGVVPGLFDTYLRLDRLDRDAAREAIVAPLARRAASHPNDSVTAEPALVERVLDQVEVGRFALAGSGADRLEPGFSPSSDGRRRIEAPYLQLVLARLWEEERRADSRVLRLETLERLGGAERIVRTHLDVALAALTPGEQKVAADVFRYLVSPSGTKIALGVDDLAEYAGQPPARVASVLGRLAAGDARVVRPAGEDAYEIYHDVLAAAILDWRQRFLRAREQSALERRRRRRSRLAIAALALTFVAGAAAGIAAWRVHDNRTTAAQHLSEAQQLERARQSAVPYFSAIYTGHEATLSSVAFHPDGKLAVSADERGDVRIWETDTGQETAALHTDGALAQATFSPDGSLVAAAGDAGNAIVWRWQSGEQVAMLHEPVPLEGASFDPSGQLVALAGDDGTVRLWNWRDGRVDAILDAPGYGYIVSAAFSRDGRLLVASSDDGNVRVWDWRNQRILARLVAGVRSVPHVAISPDGRFLATVGQDATARVWDWRARRIVWSTLVNGWAITGVAFSPDGKFLATAHDDTRARVWDWRRKRLVASLRGHSDGVRSIAFSPNGCLVATAGSGDRTARVWAPPLPGCG